MLEYILADGRPLSWSLKFWPVAVVAFVIALAGTWLCEKIALRLGIVDKPDQSVKTHQKPTAYLGGIGIFIGLAAGALCALYLLPQDFPPLARKWLLGIICAGAIACAVGTLDDIFDIRPWQKVLGQAAAGIVLLAVGVTPMLYSLGQPAKLLIDAIVIMVFVLGATNSLNLLDGLDGLCGGVTAVMAAAMLFLATLMGIVQGQGDCVRIVISLALLGGVCGFLPFNYPRAGGARIFMGDAGSLLLGLNMAVLMILFAERSMQFWMASVAVFGLPILDTAVAFARRLINKRPLSVSDRGHIYDQMMDRGLSLKMTVNLCYALTAMYAAAGLVISRLQLAWAIVACIAIAGISVLVVWRKGYLKMTGLRGEVRKEKNLD
jgi:UDP-GlcNAc:undecaprenyl-phosphate GlcNAc-1-phosphate transferase